MLEELSRSQVQISVKVDRQLRDEFSRAVADEHLGVSQAIRKFMRDFIESHNHEPNEETIAAIEEARSGKGLPAKDVDELFRQCGIL